MECHKCGRSYLKRKAKKTSKKAPKDAKSGFKKYSRKDRSKEED